MYMHGKKLEDGTVTQAKLAPGVGGTSGYSGFNAQTSGYSGVSGYSGTYSGYSGQSGATGANGSNGADGASGFSGFSGIGTSGYSGTPGPTGSTGQSGYSGFSGENNTSGFSGYSGKSGYSGFTGYSGFSGGGGGGGLTDHIQVVSITGKYEDDLTIKTADMDEGETSADIFIKTGIIDEEYDEGGGGVAGDITIRAGHANGGFDFGKVEVNNIDFKRGFGGGNNIIESQGSLQICTPLDFGAGGILRVETLDAVSNQGTSALIIQTGSAQTADNNAGAITLVGGNATTGNAADISITAGNATDTDGVGGDILIQAGNCASDTYQAGSVIIKGGYNGVEGANGTINLEVDGQPVPNGLLTANGGAGRVGSIPLNTYAPFGSGVPTGSIIAFAGSSAPDGWLLCDGTAYVNSSYPALYAVITETYGSPGGSQFNVPNLGSRNIRGVGGANSVGLGETGGDTSQPSAYSSGDLNIAVTTLDAISGAIALDNTTVDMSGVTASLNLTGGGSLDGSVFNATTINTAPDSDPVQVMTGFETSPSACGSVNTLSNAALSSGSGTISGGPYTITASGYVSSTVQVKDPYLGLNYIIKT